MFFSIIIPTYNPHNYILTLFNSIITNQCINDVEIIIADDKSDEDLSYILSLYPQCNCKIITNDKHYGFSRVGRENGRQQAQGKWICFIDQDDYLLNGVLDNIKTYIENNNIMNYISTNIYQQLTNNEFKHNVHPWSLTHGKFYERAFLEQYNIHYPNVQYCEDSNWQSLVECILINNHLSAAYYDLNTYVWVEHDDSQSHSNQAEFFFNSFIDFIQGEFVNFIEGFIINTDQNADEWYINKIISQLFEIYFQFQMLYIKSFNFPEIPFNFYSEIKKALIIFLNKTQLTQEDLLNLIENNYAVVYTQIRNELIFEGQLFLIEKDSLSLWITKVLSSK